MTWDNLNSICVNEIVESLIFYPSDLGFDVLTSKSDEIWPIRDCCLERSSIRPIRCWGRKVTRSATLNLHRNIYVHFHPLGLLGSSSLSIHRGPHISISNWPFLDLWGSPDLDIGSDNNLRLGNKTPVSNMQGVVKYAKTTQNLSRLLFGDPGTSPHSVMFRTPSKCVGPVRLMSPFTYRTNSFQSFSPGIKKLILLMKK